MIHTPFFEFARDICGYHYLQPSVLNRQMAMFFEKSVNAWRETRWKTGKRAKLMALIPRKGRKSTMFTQSGPPYMLVHEPNLSIVIDSEKKERANDFMGACARIMSGEAGAPICPANCDLPAERFDSYFGSWKSDDRQWRDDRIVVATRTHLQRKEPSIVTCSVEIGYTGGAPDVIMIDDPMSPESHNEVWMNNVIRHYNGLGPIGMPNALYFLAMTRYDDMDLAGHIERQEGWHVCEADESEACIRAGKCTKSSDTHPEPWHVMFRRAWDDNEKSIDEAIWPTSFLHAEQKKYPSFFAAQYLNDPWQNPDSAFQPEDFTYVQEVPPDVTKVLTTDTAWKDPNTKATERGGDWNVFIVGCHQASTGRVYVTKVKRGRWTMGEWGDELVKILRDERNSRVPISRMTYEDIRSSKGAIPEAIKAACQRWGEMSPALIEVKRSAVSDDKIRRIKGTAQYFQNHWVHFVRPCKNTDRNHGACTVDGCAGFHYLRNEMLKLGATMHDDCADAMADHFHPDVYHAPSVKTNIKEIAIQRPYDDILKPYANETGGYTMTLDENDKIVWVPNDQYYGYDPV